MKETKKTFSIKSLAGKLQTGTINTSSNNIQYVGREMVASHSVTLSDVLINSSVNI